MNMIMKRSDAINIVDEQGWDGFIDMLDKQYKLDFYSVSVEWYKYSNYICKAKGAKGDMLITWETE